MRWLSLSKPPISDQSCGGPTGRVCGEWMGAARAKKVSELVSGQARHTALAHRHHGPPSFQPRTPKSTDNDLNALLAVHKHIGKCSLRLKCTSRCTTYGLDAIPPHRGVTKSRQKQCYLGIPPPPQRPHRLHSRELSPRIAKSSDTWNLRRGFQICKNHKKFLFLRRWINAIERCQRSTNILDSYSSFSQMSTSPSTCM